MVTEQLIATELARESSAKRMSKRRLNENWDDFRYFLAVARTGTLSAAAERLGTDHTTVARHIHSLEEDLNHRLFHKSNLGYGLTAAGERLLTAAEALESAFVSAKATTREEDRVIAGTVRIAAPDGLASVFLAPRVGALMDRHPALEIEIYATGRLLSLSKREADIAIGFSRAQHMRVASRRLIDYRLYVYASRSYLETAAPIREKRDLEKHRFIGYIEELLFAPELNYLSVINENIEARLRCTNLLAQAQATLAGRGFCILPAFIASTYPDLVPVLPEEVSLTRTFHMHIHEDHRNVAHVREVARFISNEIEKCHSLFCAP